MAKVTETREPQTVCGHPAGCIKRDDNGYAHCAWCEEVARLREKWSTCQKELKESRRVIETVIANGIECSEELRASRLCWQEEQRDYQSKLSRLREELERLRGGDGHPHESGDECMECKRLATERGYPWCDQCLLTIQLQYCNDFAVTAQDEMEQSWKEIERLRALIPDMGMLNWLVKAAHRWWKDNGGEGMQKDIAAGYALVERLHEAEETKVDET